MAGFNQNVAKAKPGTAPLPINASRPPVPLLIIATIFALVVLAQGISAPFQKDAEPQSAEWVQSVARGNLLAPRDYYGFLVEKPPVYYWLSGAVTRMTGGVTDEVRARVIPLLAGTALAIEVLVWTSEYVGATEGWLSLLFLLGIYGYAVRATLALTDMTMTFFIVSTLVVMYPQIEGNVTPWRTIASLVLLQLAVLTKGPVAFVLVGFAILIYLLLAKRNPFALLRERWIWVVGVGVIVLTFGWYVFWFVDGSPYLFKIFITENFGHFAPARYGGTGEAARPFWYIAAHLIGESLPVVVLLPAAVAAMVTGEIEPERRKALLFQASLAIAVVIFFSLGSAKRDDYTLPAFPAVAILCASLFMLRPIGIGRTAWGARLRTISIYAVAIAMFAAVVLLIMLAATHAMRALRLDSSDSDELALILRGFGSEQIGVIAFTAVIVAGAAAALFFVKRDRIIPAGAAVGILALAASLMVCSILRPELARERSAKAFVSTIHAQVGKSPLFIVGEPNYDLSFYYGRAIPRLTGKHAAVPPASETSFVVANNADLRFLPAKYQGRLRLVVRSHQISGAGPLALYRLE